MKKTGALLALICLSAISWSQCTWTSIFYDSYEYTTVIPYIQAGTTYQNTPQTFAGCVRTGSRGMYLNIVNGYTGLLYSQPFNDVCVGQNYRFTFSTRDAFSSTNNLTFNVWDNNNVLLATQNVINNSVWNDITMPSFTATTTTIRFEIVTNTAGGAGNDAGFDDLRLHQCQPNAINYTITECTGAPGTDLFSEQSGTLLSNTGVWTGPSALTNGYLGTFSPATNSNGIYHYTIDGAVGCADSVAHFNVQYIQTPVINPVAPISACQTTTLPAITGTNITTAASYFTGMNGTGTAIAAGTAVTTSQTLYIYDGTTGCSDEEPVSITVSQPYTAGNDNSAGYCTPVGILDLNTFVSGNTGPAGTWAETTVPVSGAFNAGNGQFDTDIAPSGDYTFSYTAPANGACPSDQALFTISIGGQLSVDLGNDTTFCQGQGLTLSPGVFDTYLWDNNSVNPTRYVSLPGTYHVRVGTTGDNILVNGDFEQGSTGFTTNYTPGVSGTWGPLSNPGTYAVTTSPNLVHTNFAVCQDHTPAPGTKMMVVNGAGTPNTNVWCQTVPVQPNTDYHFSTWVSSVENNQPVAQLQFNINSTNLGTIFSPAPTACQWAQFYQVWNAGLNTSAQICIVNQNTAGAGNDFALDDISFAPICYAYDTIVIGNYPQPLITVSPNDTICQGETAQLTGSSTSNGLTYTWNPGAITGNPLNVSPTVSTVYSVNAVSPEGCVSNNVNRTIIVRPTPVAGLFINGNDTICNGSTALIDGTSTLPLCTFLWTPTGGTGTQESVSPSVTTSYTLEVTSQYGCQDDTTATLYVIQDLDVDISGTTSFCDGSGTTLTVTSNQPTMQYNWLPTGQTTSQISVSSANAGWIYVTGDYFFCPQAIDSVEITVIPNPTVLVPEDVEICPGESIELYVASDQAGSTFVWNPGNLTGSSNIFTVNETTTYYVYAQNGACVSAVDTFTINASAACMLSVPNVFTPNGDQTNDFFQLINHEGIESLTCVIVNRWGNTIREFDNANFQWDGKDESGNEVSEGVYFYHIIAVSKAGVEMKEQGIVELVK